MICSKILVLTSTISTQNFIERAAEYTFGAEYTFSVGYTLGAGYTFGADNTFIEYALGG
jgi:hypothetical protein